MEHNLLIGKYTLESLTSGMYLSPLDLYREYVQNAADAIDKAVKLGYLTPKAGKIQIDIDSKNHYVKIEDNGCGIADTSAEQELTDIGNSHKDYRESRGFRGIGRLSGLSYCAHLRFTTTSVGSKTSTAVTFDCKRLKRHLTPLEDDTESIEDALYDVITVSHKNVDEDSHFFRVEMFDAENDDGLLERTKVINYLEQTLPLPFADDFIWGPMIHQRLNGFGVQLPEYNVYLNFDGKDRKLVKPYHNKVSSDRIRRIEDPIQDIHFETFNIHYKPCAVLWYAETNYYGTIINPSIKGIRKRHGNIMFGDGNSLREYFKEERFNGWLCGELIFCSDLIVPNARRDDFEKTNAYIEVLRQFSEWTTEIAKVIRSKSHQRSKIDEKSSKLLEAETDQPDSEPVIDEPDLDQLSSTFQSVDELDDEDNSDSLTTMDLFNKLSILTGARQQNVTKYKALNISSKLTIEQKTIYEKVFDLMYDKLPKNKAEEVVQLMINELT